MVRKPKQDLSCYSKIRLIQPLAHNTSLSQIYTKKSKGWEISYETNSIYHVCPYDGVFRKCADCGALNEDFDVNTCLKKIQTISSGALVKRIDDCTKAGLEVEYMYED